MVNFYDDNSIYVNYDGAHAGLIAGGEFQDPNGRGLRFYDNELPQDSLGSTRRIIVSLEKYADDIKKSHFSRQYKQSSSPPCTGEAIALAESTEFGKEYAKQGSKRTQKRLLNHFSILVLQFGEKRGNRITSISYRCFQIWRWWNYKKRIEKVNIILNRSFSR